MPKPLRGGKLWVTSSNFSVHLKGEGNCYDIPEICLTLRYPQPIRFPFSSPSTSWPPCRSEVLLESSFAGTCYSWLLSEDLMDASLKAGSLRSTCSLELGFSKHQNLKFCFSYYCKGKNPAHISELCSQKPKPWDSNVCLCLKTTTDRPQMGLGLFSINSYILK